MGTKKKEKKLTHCFAVCAYGESPYLSACLRSLQAQSVQTHIVMCTSTPSPFLTALAEQYDVPLFVREGESSLMEDWNFAAQTAAKETGASLVTIAHQDDVYERDYAKAALHAAMLAPDLSVFCTRCRTINEAGDSLRTTAERVKRILRLPLRLHAIADRTWIKRLPLRFGNAIVCPSCTYNLNVTALPLFRRKYRFVIDWDALWRIAAEPGRFVCVERELLRYRVHADAATGQCIADHTREREEREMFSRIWPKPIVVLLMHFYRKAYRDYSIN